MISALPNKIYRYSRFEGFSGNENYGTKILMDFKLFAPSIEKFNDPFDISLPYIYSAESFTLENFTKKYLNSPESNYSLKEAEERYNYIKSDPEKHWRDSRDEIYKMDVEFRGIICLSGNYDNMLMWSHYADKHTGYCIGFNADKLINVLKENCDNGCKIGMVDYVESYPTLDFNSTDFQEISIKQCFTKHKLWEYEKEYRIVLNNKPNSFLDYPPDAITDIYLGCRMPEDLKDDIIKFLKKNNLEINLYQMDTAYHKFGLKELKINY